MEICKEEQCTGCGACLNACPINCIQMIENEEGFIAPYIDKEKCKKCGNCIRVCPNNNQISSNFPKTVYAATTKDQELLLNSSSGGIFSEIAMYILEKKGCVFGVAFNEELVAEHIKIVDKNELYKLRGSKYVQSNTKRTFGETKKELEKNRKVLFVGTPCQIAGLNMYLGKKYDNLLTIDLICHGVPSQDIFNKYIKYISKNKYISDFKFRKKIPNDTNCMILSYKIGNIKKNIKNPFIDSYYYGFLNGYIYRKSCYTCKYANCNRIGDITLGDFWGAENYHSEFKNKVGVSAVCINTEKGEELINKINMKLYMIKSNIENVKKKNHNLVSPTKAPKCRENIYREFKDKGYEYIAKNYLTVDKKWKLKIKSVIPLKIKENIQCLLMKCIKKK